MTMEIIVCVKRVPDLEEAEIEIGPDGRSVTTDDLAFGLSEWDSCAVEEAIRISGERGGRVTAVTVGNEDSEDVLRRALAMGADEAVRISASGSDRPDAHETARLLAAAIAERRFAFSTNRSETLVDPPPASLWLTDLPDALARLFELAFRNDNSNGSGRPQAQQWVEQLDVLIRQRTTCKIESVHTYFSSLQKCPWCRIEDEGGPSFFEPAGGTSRISLERLESLDVRLRMLGPFSFPYLTYDRKQKGFLIKTRFVAAPNGRTNTLWFPSIPWFLR